MAGNKLSAIITADGQQFTKTLGQLQAQLKKFEAGLKTASNTQSFDRLTRAIDATKNRITALNSGGLDKFVRGQNQAGQAVTDFSRIIQDAPYVALSGNISAIANNIDPFVLSLQRAKAAGGGFSGTLKAIGSSLAGGAGIGLAISLVTSSLVLFGDKLFGASAASKAANEAIKELSASVAKEAVQLTTIVGLIENTNTSQADREKALKLLNQEYKEYLSNLGIEEVNLTNLRASYDAVINSLLRQAVVKGLQAEITAEVEKTAGAVIKLRKEAIRRANEAKSNVQEELTAEQKAAKAKEQLTKDIQLNTQARQDGAIALQAYNRQVVTSDILEQQLIDQLKAAVAPALQLTDQFADLGQNLQDTGNKGDKALNDIISKAKQLASFLDERSIRRIEFEVDPRDTLQQAAQKAKEFLDRVATTEGVLTFPLEFDVFFNTQISSITAGIEKSFANLPSQVEELREKIEKEINKLTAQNPVLVQFRANMQGIDDEAKKMEKDMEGLNDALRSGIVSTFDSVAVTIGDALAGIDIGGRLFEIVGSLIQQIGRALISFAIARGFLDKILKNPLFSNPANIAAAGLAAIAIGQLVKGLRPAGARAQGGPVSPGQPVVVGEQGKEVFVPSTAGRIVSNRAIEGAAGVAGGGMAVNVAGEFRIRGNELVALIAKINQSQNRLT